MSLYTVGGKGLNEYEPDPQPDPSGYIPPDPSWYDDKNRQEDEMRHYYDSKAAAAPGPDATEAANAALQIVVNPTSLITDAAASPSLPWPIAVIGICVLGMIWANYLDGGRKK